MSSLRFLANRCCGCRCSVKCALFGIGPLCSAAIAKDPGGAGYPRTGIAQAGIAEQADRASVEPARQGASERIPAAVGA